jgi:hypothetical protein
LEYSPTNHWNIHQQSHWNLRQQSRGVLVEFFNGFCAFGVGIFHRKICGKIRRALGPVPDFFPDKRPNQFLYRYIRKNALYGFLILFFSLPIEIAADEQCRSNSESAYTSLLDADVS